MGVGARVIKDKKGKILFIGTAEHNSGECEWSIGGDTGDDDGDTDDDDDDDDDSNTGDDDGDTGDDGFALVFQATELPPPPQSSTS